MSAVALCEQQISLSARPGGGASKGAERLRAARSGVAGCVCAFVQWALVDGRYKVIGSTSLHQNLEDSRGKKKKNLALPEPEGNVNLA